MVKFYRNLEIFALALPLHCRDPNMLHFPMIILAFSS